MGPILCLVSAACFGAMAVLGKLAQGAGVSTDALLLLRFTIAALVLVGAVAARPAWRRPTAAPTPTAGEGRRAGWTRVVATALALGVVGYATQAGLYFAALERMDASLLSLVLYTYPLMVTVAAVAMGRDRLTRRRTLALTVATLGTALVLLGAGATSLDGFAVLLAFGSALTYTVYILVADTVVGRMPPVLLAALVMTGAAATFAVRALVAGGVDVGFGVQGWIWICGIAVVSTVLAMLTFFAGLARTGPSTAAILSTFEPVVTTALAGAVLGEFLTPIQLAGGLLVLTSVAVLQLRRQAPASGRRTTAVTGETSITI